MSTSKKWNLLFLKDVESQFDVNTNVFEKVFKSVDITQGREEALKIFETKEYDIVVSDLSVDPKEVAFLKQLQDKKPTQTIFALMSPKDKAKLYGVADLGIHAFELLPEQFEQALEAIAEFNPYETNL